MVLRSDRNAGEIQTAKDAEKFWREYNRDTISAAVLRVTENRIAERERAAKCEPSALLGWQG